MVLQVVLTPDADALDQDLAVAGGRELVVRVETARGELVGEAQVGAHDSHGRRIDGARSAIGEFSLLLPAGEWRLDVRPGNTGERRLLGAFDIAPPSETQKLTITLQEADQVAGVVRDPERRGVESVRIVGSAGGRDEWRATSGPDGHFTMDVARGAVVDLRVTDQVVRAPVGQRTDWPWYGEAKSVLAGSTGIELMARPAARGRSLTVVTLSPAGEAVGGMWVLLLPRMPRSAWMTTDARGRAAFVELLEEPMAVLAEPDPAHLQVWATQRIESVVPDGQDVVVQFRER